MKLTRGIIEKRQEDFKTKEKPNIYTISPSDTLKLGCFKIEFFRVNHNIPDSVGVVIHTPQGMIIHTGDFKFDDHPVSEKPIDKPLLAKLGKQGVLVLMSDSTNAEQEGRQISEKTIGETLEKIIKEIKGRIIIASFASLISRIQQIIWIAERLDRKIAIDGYSMKTNVEIAKRLGYLKIKKNTLVTLKQVKKLPANKIIILCTGAQGEERAVLMRIANREHKQIEIEKEDTIIFSSSVIPGNEQTIQKLKDILARQADIIDYNMMDVHTGGHARSEDLKELIQLIKPKYFIPIEGNYSFLKAHAKIAESAGIKPQNILIADNGQIIEFEDEKGLLTKKYVPTDYVMVDGLGTIDSKNIVLRDRKMLAADGMFVIIVTIEGKTGKLVTSPDIISRGFVYMKEEKKLIENTRNKVKGILKTKNATKKVANYAYIKNKIRNDIGQFLFSKTERRPMILPVVIEV